MQLLDLPPEIIQEIACQLRLDSWGFDDGAKAWFDAVHAARDYVVTPEQRRALGIGLDCPCTAREPLPALPVPRDDQHSTVTTALSAAFQRLSQIVFSTDSDRPTSLRTPHPDPSLAFSSTCRLLRQIVFTNNPNRGRFSRIACCDWWMQASEAVSETVRSRCTALRVEAGSQHPSSEVDRCHQLAGLFRLFPNIVHLYLSWTLQLSDTRAAIVPGLLEQSLSHLETLHIFVQQGAPIGHLGWNNPELGNDVDELRSIFQRFGTLRISSLGVAFGDLLNLVDFEQQCSQVIRGLTRIPFPELENLEVELFIDVDEDSDRLLMVGALERMAHTILNTNSLKTLRFKACLVFHPVSRQDVFSVRKDRVRIIPAYVPSKTTLMYTAQRLKVAHPTLRHFGLDIAGRTYKMVDGIAKGVGYTTFRLLELRHTTYVRDEQPNDNADEQLATSSDNYHTTYEMYEEGIAAVYSQL